MDKVNSCLVEELTGFNRAQLAQTKPAAEPADQNAGAAATQYPPVASCNLTGVRIIHAID